MPWPQIEMVGIAQDNLGAQLFQDVLRNGFDRPSGAHRHERGRLYRAVGGGDARLAGRAGLELDGEWKSH